MKSGYIGLRSFGRKLYWNCLYFDCLNHFPLYSTYRILWCDWGPCQCTRSWASHRYKERSILVFAARWRWKIVMLNITYRCSACKWCCWPSVNSCSKYGWCHRNCRWQRSRGAARVFDHRLRQGRFRRPKCKRNERGMNGISRLFWCLARPRRTGWKKNWSFCLCFDLPKTGSPTADFYQIWPKQKSELPMVVVDHSHFEVLLIIGDSSGVRVPGALWVWHHMSYGQAFGHIHSQVMCSGKSSDKLQSMWRKTSNNAISTANKDKVFTNTQAVCTLCLKRKEKVWTLWTLSECLLVCWK